MRREWEVILSRFSQLWLALKSHLTLLLLVEKTAHLRNTFFSFSRIFLFFFHVLETFFNLFFAT